MLVWPESEAIFLGVNKDACVAGSELRSVRVAAKMRPESEATLGSLSCKDVRAARI